MANKSKTDNRTANEISSDILKLLISTHEKSPDVASQAFAESIVKTIRDTYIKGFVIGVLVTLTFIAVGKFFLG